MLVPQHGLLLSVVKYIASTTATVREIGLEEDDGVPQLRSGEIVKLINGVNEVFALVDSTYEGATSRSQVVSYDGQGWRTWYEDSSDNKNLYTGIVTSVNKHQLMFSTTDGVKSITLSRTGLNPKRIASSTFATAGTHISPRFDAGTKAFPKLATKLTLYLDDMSANETVTATYQIDQAANAISRGWTALGGANTADGAVEIPFPPSGGGVGVQFYDIQFRFALARGGTSTNSPNIKSAVLSYLKLLGRKKQWTARINTAEAGSVGKTPKELHDAITTIIGTNTLMPFTFRDASDATDTHYVMLQPVTGFIPTGRNWGEVYEVSLIEI